MEHKYNVKEDVCKDKLVYGYVLKGTLINSCSELLHRLILWAGLLHTYVSGEFTASCEKESNISKSPSSNDSPVAHLLHCSALLKDRRLSFLI